MTKNDVTFTVHKDITMEPLEGKDVSSVLKRGVAALRPYKHWLSAGTALGLYRDGKPIPHDTDLDVGIQMEWDDPRALSDAVRVYEAMRRADFELIASTVADDRASQLAFVSPEGIVFDIYFFYSGIDPTHLLNFNTFGTMRKPKRFVEKLESWDYQDEPYPFPSPGEEYLAWRFGEDWRTPKESKAPWYEDAACLEVWP